MYMYSAKYKGPMHHIWVTTIYYKYMIVVFKTAVCLQFNARSNWRHIGLGTRLTLSVLVPLLNIISKASKHFTSHGPLGICTLLWN